MRENMEGRMRDFKDQQDTRSDGEVRVERPTKSSSKKVEEGDYVDFEEVD